MVIHFWLRATQRVNRLLALACALIVLGILLLINPWKGVGWIPAVGTAALGAGFAILVSSITGIRAIHEQYAKEANLRRKDTIYAPLHAEVKKLRGYLERAEGGEVAYPQHIDLKDEPPPSDLSLSVLGYDSTSRAYSLALWADYSADHRRNEFTAESRRRLDTLCSCADVYNSAVDAARKPTISILETCIRTSIQQTLADPRYEHERSGVQRNGYGEPRNDPDKLWVANLADGLKHTPDITAQWSWGWIENWGQQTPRTLGWLLARQPEKAAKHVHSVYEHAAGANNPPLGWFEEAFTVAWRELSVHPTYHGVWDAEQALCRALRDMEARLDAALYHIQNRYEGGQPPL